MENRQSKYINTFCAISSPQGNGAIAVIRINGDEAYDAADKIFYPAVNTRSLSELKPKQAYFGQVKEDEKIIDEVLLMIYQSPHSYTGDNMVEIFCHGSHFVQRKILQMLIDMGVRIAQPGEFTMRAFQNGKMDLAQAEGVADLIASNSEASHKLAMQQMRGGFSDEIKKLREKLLNFISLIELELDFSEEDVEFADRSQFKSLLEEINSLIEKLMNSFELGNAIKNGYPVAIAGNTNVGKSTLLNRLLNEEKAIVTDIAGTTRDVIEDVINIRGMEFRFIDTAGIRDTADKIESIGIERTFTKIDKAKIVLLVVDSTQDADYITQTIKKVEQRIQGKNINLIVLMNKVDQISSEEKLRNTENLIKEILKTDDEVLRISAKTGKNTEKLIETLLEKANFSKLQENDILVTNTRHYEALRRAHESLQRAREGMETGLPTDLLAMDIRDVIHYLGEITGDISTDEILGNIFAHFCIGK
ncbi:MAG: tRNA uridine-5-carboxymethylaminomethyl(34) synthesis GTPase MnmE [Bacteroidales bacterium]